MLPVSDDGGSTSEIVKVVGGPGIGDIRSRLVRLAETKSVEVCIPNTIVSGHVLTAFVSLLRRLPVKGCLRSSFISSTS
jgi:hypothetical protein